MKPPAIVCPACGHDDLDPIVGGYLCRNCGHVFAVVNGKAQDMDDDDDAA